MAIPAISVSRKRSLEDIPDNEQSTRLEGGCRTCKVASVEPTEESEEELDRRLLLEAAELGIPIEQETPLTMVHEIVENPTSLEPSFSRLSESTHPTSCSSSEQQPMTNASSFSISSFESGSPSVVSFSAGRSSFTRIKRGFRRLPGFRWKKSMRSPTTPFPLVSSSVCTAVDVEPDIVARVVALKKLSISEAEVGMKRAITAPCPYTLTMPAYDPAATQRSLENEQLKDMRARQVQEQIQIMQAEEEQRRKSRTGHERRQSEITTHYRQLEQGMKERHSQAMMDMEDRHLAAEVDLHRALKLERQACETRLRHMEAYCNSPCSIEGMPIRIVTGKDFRGLAQQYHMRDSMESLHDSRINVIREKQAKQLEGVATKQDEELSGLAKQRDAELAVLESSHAQSMEDDQIAFEDTKRKLARRWFLAEAVMRRRLEIETGEIYAPLAPLTWDTA